MTNPRATTAAAPLEVRMPLDPYIVPISNAITAAATAIGIAKAIGCHQASARTDGARTRELAMRRDSSVTRRLA